MEKIKLCETCGKEHSGFYGSGRFCSYNCKQKFVSVKGASKGGQSCKQKYGIKCSCEFCGKKFETKQDLRHHYSQCDKKGHKVAYNNWKCAYCNDIFATRRLLVDHRKNMHPNESHRGGSHHIECYCRYCGQKSSTPNGNTVHEKSCIKNPNRVDGVTKGLKLSEEHKKKISESRKRYLKEHPDKIPYVMNHSSKVSYPEKYFMEVFKNLPVKYNYQVGLYQLDFAIPEKMVYIEIDGEQHFCDKRIVEHDKERTEKLESLGWNCLKRVRWSDYKKLNHEQQKQYCNELIQLLSK